MPGALSVSRTHDCDDLIALFNHQFAAKYRTILAKNGDEPLYQPAVAQTECHRVIFRHDYFASALHEVAHWCIAGKHRRMLTDYGYWYTADGRTPSQQRHFERVEARPQALEWIFAQAARYQFAVSNDNLAAGQTSSRSLEQAVYQQVVHYCRQGLPQRAEQFRLQLALFYGSAPHLDAAQFTHPSCA